jgi:RNA polymerase sigma-70 factor, ECF subfamily
MMDEGERVRRDRWLRGAVLAGDETAWRAWYEEHYSPLEAYVRWRCGGLRDLTDDVLQEMWLTAVRRVQSFRPETASFRQWLCGIAANVIRNQLRSRSRRRRLHESLLNGSPPKSDGADESEHGETIARALTALPERYEQVLRAKYLEQKSVDDIAAAGGETPKAIESLLGRARQAFREAYLTEDAS